MSHEISSTPKSSEWNPANHETATISTSVTFGPEVVVKLESSRDAKPLLLALMKAGEKRTSKDSKERVRNMIV